MADALTEATDKLNKEFEQVRQSLGDVHVAFDAVRDAVPTDNLHDLLLTLEKAVKDARDGGVLRSGANGHRRALERYRELRGL